MMFKRYFFKRKDKKLFKKIKVKTEKKLSQLIKLIKVFKIKWTKFKAALTFVLIVRLL